MTDDATPTLDAPGPRDRTADLPRAPRLVIVHPPDLIGEVHLDGAPRVLGRAPPDPAARLLSPTLSREHARLTVEPDGGLLVEDLESRNGTFSRGDRLTRPVAVTSGDVLRFGDVVAVYETRPPVSAPELAELPGRSVAAARLRAEVVRAASSRASAVIIGETGVGKERVARALHHLSQRPGPFVAVNCAELSGELFAGALFGHERGAFTGADHERPGLVRAAARGTLLLDEIGELELGLQAKLLRVLEEQEVLPVGASRAIAVNVRFIASTHRNLLAAVAAGTFRRDLYARLALIELRVPSLAARKVDVLDWLARFVAATDDELGGRRPPLALEGAAAEWLVRRAWPGNLRELRAVALRLRLDGADARWSAGAIEELLGASMGDNPHLPPTPESERDAPAPPRAERPPAPTPDALRALLAAHGSVRAVAKVLGGIAAIYRWLEAWAIERG